MRLPWGSGLQWGIVTLGNGRQALRVYEGCLEYSEADSNEDCLVNLVDLLTLVSNWLGSSNYDDFSVLSRDWTGE